MNYERRFDEIISVISPEIGTALMKLPAEIKQNTFEIRLRIGCPVALTTNTEILYLTNRGTVENFINNESCIASKKDVSESFKMLCGYSIYSFQDEIKNGFITIKNGHRVGIAGTAVVQNGSIFTVKDVSSLNYRIARQIKGVASPIVDRLFGDSGIIEGTIIAGTPSSGKTTILRDLAALLSDGYLGRYIKTAVVDERGELGAVYLGQAGNDMGASCDILNGYPKDEGIMIALRCLSPEVIVCDEIGTQKEVEAVESGVNAGVPIITTVHADSIAALQKRPQSRALLATGAFSYIVMLEGAKNPGIIKEYIKVSDIL